jgi:hypothetical protein
MLVSGIPTYNAIQDTQVVDHSLGKSSLSYGTRTIYMQANTTHARKRNEMHKGLAPGANL